jgi:hypothetical protein
MKRNFYISGFLFLLVFGMQEMAAQTMNVTLDFATDPEWDGSGNTGNSPPNLTDFGYRNIEGITGVTEGDYGSIGGIFCRTTNYSYYADTDLNGVLDRTMTFKISGIVKLENRSSSSFDGDFFLGYFDATNPDRNNFVGVHFVEPSGLAEAPFRGFTGVYGPGGAHTEVIDLAQSITLTFDLTWTGSADGSGTFTGTLAGQDVNLLAGAGNGSFNAFGLMCGGTATDGNRATRNCYFDNITYTKIDDGSGGSTALDQNPVDRININPSVTADMVYFSNVAEYYQIELVDLEGKTLLKRNALELNNGLSLEPYSSGLFLIRVMKDHEQIKTVKVLKK